MWLKMISISADIHVRNDALEQYPSPELPLWGGEGSLQQPVQEAHCCGGGCWSLLSPGIAFGVSMSAPHFGGEQPHGLASLLNSLWSAWASLRDRQHVENLQCHLHISTKHLLARANWAAEPVIFNFYSLIIFKIIFMTLIGTEMIFLTSVYAISNLNINLIFFKGILWFSWLREFFLSLFYAFC